MKINTRQFFNIRSRYLHALAKSATAEGIALQKLYNSIFSATLR